MHTDGSAPTFYELVPLAQRYSTNFWTRAPQTPPAYVLDLDGPLRLIDPDTVGVVAFSPLAQVSATPGMHTYGGGESVTLVVS